MQMGWIEIATYARSWSTCERNQIVLPVTFLFSICCLKNYSWRSSHNLLLLLLMNLAVVFEVSEPSTNLFIRDTLPNFVSLHPNCALLIWTPMFIGWWKIPANFRSMRIYLCCPIRQPLLDSTKQQACEPERISHKYVCMYGAEVFTR